MNQEQGELPVSRQIEVPLDEVPRKLTLGKAIEYCAELAGFGMDKQLQQRLKTDKGQFSRWLSGQEGIMWEKFERLMDTCGNDVPLYWMLAKRGYDLHSLRKLETKTEKELREAKERIASLENALDLVTGRK